MTMDSRPLSLFISYSHKDEALRAKLETHLALLKRNGVFDVWHDRKIGAGREWEGEIHDALERADVILLLVSADFLASDYCHDREMTRALERHEHGSARVVPVILRACDWQVAAFGKLQALPRGGQPIVGHPDGSDRALTQVAVALREIAAELRGPADPSGQAAAPSGSAASTVVERAPRSGVPPASPPGSQGASTPARLSPPRTIKIGSIRLGPLELGPFEISWPLRSGMRVVVIAVIGGVLAAGVAALGVYTFMVKPASVAARDFMRRGEYPQAVGLLSAVHPRLRWLPMIAGPLAEARFGAKLETEPIRNLAPELQKLRARRPGTPDVLVFEGLSAYWVQNDLERAIQLFTQAADLDREHLEAHFLAAGRYVDRAYDALLRGGETEAWSDALTAANLIKRVLDRVPFAKDLPRYANQRAELFELQGDVDGAYGVFAQLAPTHPLSAVQAAMVSWRLPNPGIRIKDGLESAEAVLSRLANDPKQTSDAVGWIFRIFRAEPVAESVVVRGTVDKVCLTSRVVEVSQALVNASEGGQAGGASTKGEVASAGAAAEALGTVKTGAPEPCQRPASVGLIHDVVCGHLLAAQQGVPDSDAMRKKILDAWRATRLHCDGHLKAAPVLTPGGGSRKVAGGRGAQARGGGA